MPDKSPHLLVAHRSLESRHHAIFRAVADLLEEPTRTLYERLLASKGESAVVGIDNSVCGGCHMKLPVQLIIACRGRKEMVTCNNCARILYFTPQMVLETED